MVTRKQLNIIVAIAALPLGVLVWWLSVPLFLDRTVNENFPLSANATIPEGMTNGDVEQVMAELAGEMQTVQEPMPAGGGPEALVSGSFEDADGFHKGEGRATVYRLAAGEHVLRFEAFRVTNGPDLRVLLTSHPGPASRADLDAAGYVELGRLKGNVGNQNYSIPAEIDLSEQRSIVIYCRPFHVVFSIARLERG